MANTCITPCCLSDTSPATTSELPITLAAASLLMGKAETLVISPIMPPKRSRLTVWGVI